jgi:hypothetical protein
MPQRYFFKRNAQSATEGPVMAAELRECFARGELGADALISLDQSTWHAAARVRGLMPEPAAAPPAAEPDAYKLADERVAAPAPPMPPPAGAVGGGPAPAAAAPGATPEAVLLEPATARYARQTVAVGWGWPGEIRNVNWFPIVGAVTLAMGILQRAIQLSSLVATMLRMSPHGAPFPAPVGTPWGMLVANGMTCMLVPLTLWLWIYALVWLYKVHREVRDFTGWQYPTSPGTALGFCFIPIFNLYWGVVTPYRLALWIETMQGKQRGAIANTVLILMILAIVPGSCVPGLSFLLWGLALRSVQKQLNVVWERAAAARRAATPV